VSGFAILSHTKLTVGEVSMETKCGAVGTVASSSFNVQLSEPLRFFGVRLCYS